jgi:hypothetical protein
MLHRAASVRRSFGVPRGGIAGVPISSGLLPRARQNSSRRPHTLGLLILDPQVFSGKMRTSSQVGPCPAMGVIL